MQTMLQICLSELSECVVEKSSKATELVVNVVKAAAKAKESSS